MGPWLIVNWLQWPGQTKDTFRWPFFYFYLAKNFFSREIKFRLEGTVFTNL